MMSLAKFRGCLIGATIGDCFGTPFEYEVNQEKYVSELFKNASQGSLLKGSLLYSDDTAMMRCIAESWIDKKTFCAKDLAAKFTKSYFQDENSVSRGYGIHVVDIFESWRSLGVNDPLQPAKLQFDGAGSFGNGGAMRVAPVALICAKNDIGQVVQLAKNTALLTHFNWKGYNGAILQAISVWKALQIDPNEKFDTHQYITSLIDEIQIIEKNNPASVGESPFSDKLTLLKDLLSRTSTTAKEVVDKIGNGIAALDSVPSAVYCFLRAMEPIGFKDQNTNCNAFERAIRLAISLGGDTDTIACMTGAISGAYYGLENIPSYLQNPCEKIEDIDNIAKSLYALL